MLLSLNEAGRRAFVVPQVAIMELGFRAPVCFSLSAMGQKIIHKHQNGLRFYKRHLPEGLIERYQRILNFHEPFQESVFEEIMRDMGLSWYSNVGAGWGYYALLARKLRKDIDIVAIEPNRNRCASIREHMELNELYRISTQECYVGRQGPGPSPLLTLEAVIAKSDVGGLGAISFDIQGAADQAILESRNLFNQVAHVLVGTHDAEHGRCELLLKELGFEIVLSVPMGGVPLQPDGILWARKNQGRKR